MNNEILTLKENENIIYEHDVSVIYLNDEYSFYLTNKNIILLKEQTRLFKKKKIELIKFSLDNIQVSDGVVQVDLEEGTDHCWDVVILLNNGLKRISFWYDGSAKKHKYKKLIRHIVENIIQLRLTGKIVIKKTTNSYYKDLDQQVEMVKKLKELLDEEILTEEEFNIKKKEIMDL